MMKMMSGGLRSAAVLAAALSLAKAGGAQAASVTSLDPAGMATALQAAGYKAKLSKDDNGDPQIDTAADGHDIKLTFFGCTNGKKCDQLEFIAAWTCGDEVKRCIATSTKWNAIENFAHSIIIEKSIALYYHLLFDKGGVSSDLFVKNFEYFARDATGLMQVFDETK